MDTKGDKYNMAQFTLFQIDRVYKTVLRDFFAGCALVGLAGKDSESWKSDATSAYEAVDAMLAAREEKKKDES